MYKDYFKELDTAQYQAKFTITENDGGGAVYFNLVTGKGTRLMITSVSAHFGTLGSNRSMLIEFRDYNSNALFCRPNYDADMTSFGFLQFPSLGTIGGAVAGADLSPIQNVVLTGGDVLTVRTGTIADGESVTIYIRGFIKGRNPTTASTGSSNTPAISTVYERIV